MLDVATILRNTMSLMMNKRRMLAGENKYGNT